MARSKAVKTVEREVSGTRHSSFIFAALVFMMVALIYVWCHIQITGLKYEIAEEMKYREYLLGKSKKLHVEIETLKSPGRIEEYARNTLKMQYPERDQVIFLK